MESQSDAGLRIIHNRSLLTVPDSVPMVWAGRYAGASSAAMSRVYGPDLMLEVCRHAAAVGWASYLHGADEATNAELPRRLRITVPGLRIAGRYSPPFRELV